MATQHADGGGIIATGARGGGKLDVGGLFDLGGLGTGRNLQVGLGTAGDTGAQGQGHECDTGETGETNGIGGHDAAPFG